MRTEEQTGRHLLLAVIITVFSGTLSLITAVMAWELWAIPLILAGCFSVWLLHIAELGWTRFYGKSVRRTDTGGILFFGVHATSLFDVPAVACIMILALFTLNKKWILHMIELLYILELGYHILILHTVSHSMELRDVFRLALGAVVVLAARRLRGTGSTGGAHRSCGMSAYSRNWRRRESRAPSF